MAYQNVDTTKLTE